MVEQQTTDEPVILRYDTHHSIYEVDHTGPGFRVRRLYGVSDPTPKQGRDGVWKDAVAVRRLPDASLLFQWSEDPSDATITSPVLTVAPVETPKDPA